MEHALAAVGERHHGVFHGRGQRASDLDVAGEKAGKGGGVVLWPKTPTLLEKPTTPMDVFDVPITPFAAFDVPRTPAMFDVLVTGGPCVPEMPLTPLSAPETLSTPGP